MIIRPNQNVVSCDYQAQSERCVVLSSGPIRTLCRVIIRPTQSLRKVLQLSACEPLAPVRPSIPSRGGFTFRCCFVQVRNEYRRALGKADWMPGCCRQCLLVLLGAPSQRQVAHLTGTGTTSFKMSLSLTSKPTNASSPSKIVEVRSPR